MPISAGDRLGLYEILAPIGKGGMGEVYRAHDTRLKRDVAIKVLPDVFAGDPERMARFQREAEVLASLNHPNIATIYGVEDRALVMEFVPGEPLKGPLPLEVALRYARQIADALEAAHEKGIIHRDLKPANILITPASTTQDSVVKVLDFGLAAVAQDPASPQGDPSKSPTLTMRATEAGMILGTASYMSPEQASGKAVDKRADIWSFGVVLFEMLTGRRLFSGETVSHTLADVLRCPIDFGQLPAGTPAGIRDLLRRCLNRDVKKRMRDIGEARIVIEESLSGGNPEPEPVSASETRKSGIVPWATAAALLVSLSVAGLGWWRATRPVDRPLMRLSVDLGPDAVTSGGITFAISPDGTRLVFPIRSKDGKQQLATRLLNQTAATVLPGTEDASDPFFSPDGQWVGLFAAGKLKKISVLGGALVTLCDAPSGWGASWGRDGYIIAALNAYMPGLSRVPASGGTPQQLTPVRVGNVARSGVLTHRWPQILPGDKAVVFTASTTNITFQYATVEVLSLRTGEIKTLVRNAYFGRYISDGESGYLVYVHDGTLFAAAFDISALELRGPPVPLIEDLAGNPDTGAGQFDSSRAGSFIYRSGKPPAAQTWPVQWLESSGKTSPLLAMPGAYISPRFSPDGQRLALSVGLSSSREIFVYDWRRDAMLRLTFGAAPGALASYPAWSPDGKHIAYRSVAPSGKSSIEWLRADGSGVGGHLVESNNSLLPYSFSPDGRLLAYAELFPETGTDIFTVPLDLKDPDHPKTGKPEIFLRTPANEVWPFFSPDGRWIAYASNASGQWEIYVRAFPASGGRWQISTRGGTHPMWSRTGRELYYETLDNHIMAADYAVADNSFIVGKPRLWSTVQIRDAGFVTNLDLAPDGKRIAVFPLPEAPAKDVSFQVTFLLNFLDEVRRKLPGT